MSAPAPQEFSARLLAWARQHGRTHLPWQRDPSPYRVWVSEVMLQQTQVATVIPYYERFMARFPAVTDLAAAPLDAVLHLWTGLGYYARARNLWRCAQVLVEQHGGEFPASLEAVMSLPGIGRSTAGAILAFARGERHAILDGNVKRVLARVFGIEGDPSSAAVLASLWSTAEACTPDVPDIRLYTQGIMDLGATLCTRARPACTVCPMIGACVAAETGRQALLPGGKRKRPRPRRAAALLLLECRDAGRFSLWLERRPLEGLWGGLWSPPQFGDSAQAFAWATAHFGAVEAVGAPLEAIEHAFTHFDLTLEPLRLTTPTPTAALTRVADAGGASEARWFDLALPPAVGLPRPIETLLARLREEIDR